MADVMNPQTLVDAEVFDPSGDKIGKVGEVYLREDSQQPAWIMVKSGLFNNHETMVPLQGAHMGEHGIQVGVDKDRIKDAPHMDPHGHLSEQDSAELYRHYGMRPEVPGTRGPVDSPRPNQGRAQSQAGQQRSAGQAGQQRSDAQARQRPGPQQAQPRSGGRRGAAEEQAEMIRSEERLNVGTEQVESGRVRLRRYVVTEQQQVTVPVSHEEVRIEREPIGERDRGRMRGDPAKLGESEQEVVLHEEKPVVRTETVPVERVRVGTDTVTEEQTVGGEVHKERVDVEPDERAQRKRRPGSVL
ncbi:MAG TPA: PRC and DUF2382 domain-containing protein [Pseudonocardiaceae bacterium]|jgi:uncharacterized protein (TIGR02271 family)|nr:PRC and DUF2382 domain-containing protein [Pseudonocardiaceae bacterium]